MNRAHFNALRRQVAKLLAADPPAAETGRAWWFAFLRLEDALSVIERRLQAVGCIHLSRERAMLLVLAREADANGLAADPKVRNAGERLDRLVRTATHARRPEVIQRLKLTTADHEVLDSDAADAARKARKLIMRVLWGVTWKPGREEDRTALPGGGFVYMPQSPPGDPPPLPWLESLSDDELTG